MLTQMTAYTCVYNQMFAARYLPAEKEGDSSKNLSFTGRLSINCFRHRNNQEPCEERHGCRFATGRQQAGSTWRAYSPRRDEKFANTANWFTFSRAANSSLLLVLPPLIRAHTYMAYDWCARTTRARVVHRCTCTRAARADTDQFSNRDSID